MSDSSDSLQHPGPSDPGLGDPGPPNAGSPVARSGFALSIRAALNASAQVGFLFGSVDAWVAWLQLGERAPQGLNAFGTFGAAVLWYGLGFFGVALLVSVLGFPWLAKRDLSGRVTWLFGALFALGSFLEIYWWTRPYVFWGLPATSVPRLAAAAGMALGALVLGVVAARLLARLPRGFHLLVALVVPLIWVGGIFFLIGDTARGAHKGVLNERNSDLPNVLLVVVDALRADVLQPYGAQNVETPRLQELAERGVVFENAFAQAPFTWSSFGSILTGKYPLRHGLISMRPGVQMVESVTLPYHLKTARRTDGAFMQDDDWASGTFITGTLSNDSGLLRGFDSYSEMMDGHDLVDQDSVWSVFRSELLALRVLSKGGQVLSRMGDFDAGHVVRNAVNWLRRHRGRRWVAMVHLYSTHTPYDPQERYREPYVDPDYSGPIQAFYADARIAIERGEYEATPEDEQQIRNLYYGGTSQADGRIGEVLDELQRLGMLEDTLVIVTSDHGEELGDHGLWEHNWMYQTNLQIPLVMAWPKGLPAGVRVDALVETIDLLPTVCDLLGLEPPAAPGPGVDNYAAIDGRSLLPLVRGAAERVRDVSFSLNASFLAVHDLEWKLILPLGAWATGEWSALAASPSARLFHLADDPQELRNLLPTEDAGLVAQVERLGTYMRDWEASMPIPRAHMRTTERDDADLAILEALGYVDGIDSPQLVEMPEKGEGSGAVDEPGGSASEPGRDK